MENGIYERIVLNERAIVEALRKSMARKPDFEGDGFDDGGNMIYDTWICPNCREKYEVDYEFYRYCPVCGQAIDWSEEAEQSLEGGAE
jgi:hypothetical protein